MSGGTLRPIHSPRRTKGGAGAIPVLLAVCALVTGCAAPAPSIQVHSSPTPVTASPRATTGSMTGEPGGSTPAPDPWAATPERTPAPESGGNPPASPPPNGAWEIGVKLPPLAPVATFEAETRGVAGVALDTAFRLTSLDGRPPEQLAARLVADPAVAFNVAWVQGTTAVVRPAAKLRDATLYRIALKRPDGTVEAAWAAQTAAPLEVADTVPGDTATGVPTSAGIEVTFDQVGVSPADLARHFSISPATEGRFEAAGRTIAFVPSSPLRRGTVYTVTVTRGLPLAGTGQVLSEDSVFRFETAAGNVSSVTIGFPRLLVDATPREHPAIGVGFDVPEGGKAPSKIPVTVHRLPSQTAAIDAYDAVKAAPEWTHVSGSAPVRTAGLQQVFKGTVPVRTAGSDDRSWIEVPLPLPAGWYVVTESRFDVPRQVVLQVTDLATFSMLTTTDSTAWVNDLRTGKPVAGAAVELAGRRLGVTDARGVWTGPTPVSLIGTDDDPVAGMLVVSQGSLASIVPVGGQTDGSGKQYDDSGDPAWWRLLSTDRTTYRQTDTINAWGVVRGRDTGTVPAYVTVALVADADDEVPIRSTTAHPDSSGAYAVSLAYKDLPTGAYRLRATTAGSTLGEQWLEVARIVKPAWRLDVTPAHRAAISGQRVTVKARATFFEGTPVAGVRLTASGAKSTTLVTGVDGVASGKVLVKADEYSDQWTVEEITAHPTLPEEAGISSAAWIAVFRSSALLDATAALDGRQLTATGKVSSANLAAFDRATGDPWAVVPYGSPRAGAKVRLQVIESTTTRRKVGISYDFITKTVVPAYEYGTREVTIATTTATTRKDGTFRARFTVRGGQHGYSVVATYTDGAKRQVKVSAWAGGPAVGEPNPGLTLSDADAPFGERTYSVGDTVRVKVDGGVANPPVERYLYAITQRGLRYVTVGSTRTFRTTFTANSVPAIGISAVRFNGHGYEAAIDSYRAALRTKDRRLAITVTPDRGKYAPGATASVAIRTLGAGGKPVSASVYVTAVDEKLYAIGAADTTDPLEELYASPGSGIIAWAVSHGTPGDSGGMDGGDTTGGGGADGGRRDFRDWLVARLVTTDRDGRATLAIPLSQDLTSWRVNATGVDEALETGLGSGVLKVGLPFFVEATIAPVYLAADRPVIRVRAYGDTLRKSDRITFTVTSDTLSMPRVTTTAAAFTAAEVPLPRLSPGTHRLRIEARTSAATGPAADALIRTIQVVPTRLTQARITWESLASPAKVRAGSGMTSLLLVDAGRGRVVPALRELVNRDPGRADVELAGALAERVLVGEFGLPSSGRTSEDGLDQFVTDDGLAIVPWGSKQLEVTALAAMAKDPRLGASASSALWDYAGNPEETRERRLLALAGMAALGDPVLDELRDAAKQPDLAAAEQVNLALAALYAGDEDLARRLERSLLATSGQRRGPWVRLAAGAGDEQAVLTARLAIVAASLGDEVAGPMDAWLAENPPRTTTVALERALAARGWASRVPGAEAVVAVTVDGTSRDMTVRPDAPVSVSLTPAQAAGARLDPRSGSVLVVTSREGALVANSLTRSKGQVV
jgi:hypothetical protein